LEIDDLRHAVSEQADELHRTEKEKNRIAAEKEDVAKAVASLEADLRRVKKNAEIFGRDLKRLRGEKEDMEESHKHELARIERSKKKLQDQIRLLNEQVENYKGEAQGAQEELGRHSCAA
jgi:predicted  nucleic acid-binding Zn-ribbon protein